MSRPIILGLSGKAEHGKSASSRILREAAMIGGLKCEILEISKLIIAHCVKLGMMPSGITREQLTPEQVKMLVDEGSRMRDETNGAYWTEKTGETIDSGAADMYVIPNVRFPDEGYDLRRRGGYIIRYNRVNEDGTPFVSLTRDPNHKTETALDHWGADYYIVNVTGKGKWLEDQNYTLFKHICRLEDK